MNIIIPLGGLGERFKNENYAKPKPLINIFGKQMICHVIDNLDLHKDDKLIIIYNKELNIHHFDTILKNKYENIVLIELNKQTEGAAETVLFGLENIDASFVKNKCVLLDCDSFYTANILNTYRSQDHNAIFCFKDIQEKPIYSYITFDSSKKVLDIKEKMRISDFANTGCYCFKSGTVLKEYCKRIMDKDIREKNEYYTSCVIKEMLNDGHVFEANVININDYNCVGTPFQLKIYCSNKINTVEKKRFCFDLDNTLVTSPEIKDDYRSVKPIYKNIELLQHLKAMGHYIIIHTARRMRTCNGNVGKIMKDVGEITFNTLNKFNIPYDELIFGKPYADFYIDDLGVNAYDNLEKSLGFYKTTVYERDFNEIKSEKMDIITKRSNNSKLHGEIYYYNNIPAQLRKFFPIFIENGNNWYSIEKIKGITMSYIYLDESLTNDMFLKYLNMFKTIHSYNSATAKDDQSLNTTSTSSNNSNTNLTELCDLEDIYSNYSAKLKERYESYDYSSYKNSHDIFNKLVEYFDNYKTDNKGVKTIIHGDAVFSNCIIDENNDFKLIDMRGKLGDVQTIYGDIFYDYAKIYQSLIGYDEILLDKIVSNEYKKIKLGIFENYIKENFGEECIKQIKMITNSLLFTLIPLHNNNKCGDFYKLIDMEI
jgi:capsule biosynthesis phosphatase